MSRIPRRPASLPIRLAVATMAGLLLGILGLALLPLFMPGLDPMVRWGFFLWYPTVGAVIAFAGAANAREGGSRALPWWLRGGAIGGWMNFVATLLSPGVMRDFMIAAFGADGLLASPFWFVAEGAVAGLVIGYLVMRFGGEGREPADD
ncbi:hypothetical protein M1105_13625 [Limibaculum sp. FT325]|uniref:hypothetical protein n=1 Tax=Thermohalobaculum sediminis TaxID=2939436 RepID=UPI0020C09192|nr:hypothetical protein [Limibaculum sediminis]MCL5778023.1 hypothetical protein [Limibaculum sediminis]